LILFDSVYADSSPDQLDDPKVETIVEIISRIWVSRLMADTTYLEPATNSIGLISGIGMGCGIDR
jgi:hypothetical protein